MMFVVMLESAVMSCACFSSGVGVKVRCPSRHNSHTVLQGSLFASVLQYDITAECIRDIDW